MTMLEFFQRLVDLMTGTSSGDTLLTGEAIPFLLAVILFLVQVLPGPAPG